MKLIPSLLFKTVVAFFCLAQSGWASEKLMDDWLNLEIQKGQLEATWSQREQDLEHRLTLMNIELQKLNEAAARRVETSSDVDQRRGELVQKQEVLEKEQSLVKAQLEEANRQIKRLLPRLPPPLQAEWKAQLNQFSFDELGNSEALERVLALFKMVEEFDGRIALHRGELEIPNHSSGDPLIVQVNQIYIGVSQGWYVNDDRTVFGYGRSTMEGWQWWHTDDASKELGQTVDPHLISQVHRMLQNPTAAEFIALPVKINQQ